MEQRVNQKRSVGSLIFLCLYGLACLKGIGIIIGHGAFVKLYSDFDLKLPSLTIFFIQYGPAFTALLIAGTLVFMLQELLSKKIITCRASAISFLILLAWNFFYVVGYFLPMFKLASLAGK